MILKTKIELVNLKQQELLGIETLITGELLVQLEDISAIRQVGDENSTDIDPNTCGIYLKSGVYFTVLTPFEEVKRLWYKI